VLGAWRGLEAREPAAVDAPHGSDLDDDQEHVAATAAPSDRAGPAEVDVALREDSGCAAVSAFGERRRHLDAEGVVQQAADGVSVELLH
jgi:hypothetical protein